MSHAGRSLRWMLFRDSCGCCGRPGDSPCQGCIGQILRCCDDLPPRVVIDDIEIGGGIWYEGAGRRLISGLKYRNRRGALNWLADQMLQTLGASSVNERFEAVTWVPSSRQGRRQRGFDTGQLLAGCVASRLGIPAFSTLRRAFGERQSERSRRERIVEGPSLAFAGRLARARVSDRRLLLVDDVCTTGASITRSRRVLLDGDADDVCVVVAAITPWFYDGDRYAQVCG